MDHKYVRMVKRMAEAPEAGGDPYTAYVVRCADGTLYTGIAKDVQARVKAHNSGRGAAYTRMRRPVVLLYQELCRDRSAALMREIQIKRLPREKKERLLCPSPGLRPPSPGSAGRGGLLAAALALVLLGEARAQDRVLSTLPEGWEIDRVEEKGKGSLPRLAWSNDVETVAYVAVSRGRRKVAVNETWRDADSVGPLGFTADGLTPVFVARAAGKDTLFWGERAFGPYDAIERPALSGDGGHVAFKARDGADWLIVSDGKVLARAPFVSTPVLDPDGTPAFWARAQGRWTLWWKGAAAPGTPFTAQGGTPELPEVASPVISPDGRHLAFWRRLGDGRYSVLRDGAASDPWLAVGEPTFSPDSRSLAYGAAAGPDYELNTMVLDERKIAVLEPRGAAQPRGLRSLWGYRFLRDGTLSWFAALVGGRSCFVVGERASSEFESLGQPAFDPGIRRVAFVGYQGGRARAVVDGEAGPPYDAVTFLQFDPAGRHHTYTARSGTTTWVVLDGKPGPAFDEVGWVRFLPDGRDVAYWGRRGDSWQTVIAGAASPAGAAADLVGNLILGGPEGLTPVYSLRAGGRWYLQAGPRREGPFDEIGPFLYDAGRRAVVCGTREGRRFLRRAFALNASP